LEEALDLSFDRLLMMMMMMMMDLGTNSEYFLTQHYWMTLRAGDDTLN